MVNNLPSEQKTDWADNQVVRPVHTNGWGEAINTLSKAVPLYSACGNVYTATYTNNVYNLTPLSFTDNTSNVTVDSYIDGMSVIFQCPTNNLANCSVNVNSLGTKVVKDIDNTNLPPNKLKQGVWVSLTYDMSNGCFKLSACSNADKLTTGAKINGVNFKGDSDIVTGAGFYYDTVTYKTGDLAFIYNEEDNVLELHKSTQDGNIGHNPLTSTGYWEKELSMNKLEQFYPPILSENGILGGSTFACYASNSYDNTQFPIYKSFNNIYTSGAIWYASAINVDVIFYNPIPVNVTNIEFKNRIDIGTTQTFTSGTIYGSNDNLTWSELGTFTNSNTTPAATYNANLSSNTEFYNYYKMSLVANGTGVGAYFKITGTYNYPYLNGKANIDLTNLSDFGQSKVANLAAPSTSVINLTLGASGTTYIMPTGGYLECRLTSGSIGGFMSLLGDNMTISVLVPYSGQQICQILPVRKNEQVKINYDLNGTIARSLRFIPLIGAESEVN